MSHPRRSVEERQQLLEEFRTGGTPRREFGEQHKIPITTLDAWRRKRKRKARLVEVAIAPEGPESPQSRSGFALVLANGRRIESSWGFAEADLVRLIRTAEA